MSAPAIPPGPDLPARTAASLPTFKARLASLGLARFDTQFVTNPSTVKKICCVGDSFTGATATGTWPSYAYALASLMRAKYGNAGLGYLPASFAAGRGGSVFATPNMSIGTNQNRWDADPNLALMPGPTGLYVNGQTGNNTTTQYTYAPNAADNFNQGSATYPASMRLHFVLRSAYTGFLVNETDVTAANAGWGFSSGAAFTASASGTTFTASAVTGVIPRRGSRVLGSGSTGTYTTGGGSSLGGAGNYTTNNSLTLSAVAMTAEGNLDPVLNIPQTVDYTRTSTSTGAFRITSVYGDLVLQGMESYNGNPGVTFTNMGYGGTTAYQWSTLNFDAMVAFWRNANFDLVLFPIGMNDRTANDATLFGTSVDRFVRAIRRGCPRTQIVLIRQTDPVDFATTYISTYTAVLQNLAIKHGCAFYDMRTADPNLATYPLALAAGFVNSPGGVADGIHPSSAANFVIATDLFNNYLVPALGG